MEENCKSNQINEYSSDVHTGTDKISKPFMSEHSWMDGVSSSRYLILSPSPWGQILIFLI